MFHRGRMMYSSSAVVAFVLASSAGLAAANSGCETLIATAEGAGLQELTEVLAAASPDLALRECNTTIGATPANRNDLVQRILMPAYPESSHIEIGTLVVGAASLAINLPDEQRVTVFAPTDTAFAEAAEKFGGELPQEALADVLLNHIVAQELTAEAIVSLLGESGGSVTVPTLLGEQLFVTTDGVDIFVQSAGLEAPGAKVTLPDQITCAGPVHVIDAVLLPTMPDGTVVEFGDAAPAMTPAISPIAVAEDGPEVAPEMTPEAAPELAPELAPEMAPGVTVDELLGFPVDVIPEAAPVEGPVDVGDRSFGAIVAGPEAVADIRPMVAPVEAPEGVPLIEEPAEGPVDGPADGPADGPEGLELDEGVAEGSTDGSPPGVEAETDSAMPSGFFSSTLAAAAVAVLVVVA